jgi:asparagine synthase (glutamine-hydrolysing)
MEEPFADASIISTAVESSIARKYVKVVLAGHGSEELFAGHERYMKARTRDIYSKLPGIIRDPITSVFGKNQRISEMISVGNIQDEEYRFFETNSIFASEERHNLLVNPMQNSLSIFNKSNANTQLDKQLYAGLKFILPNQLLKKVDTASMFSGLQPRLPFLDHNFVEFAVSIPSNKKLNFTDNKSILKKVASSYLPKEIACRKKQRQLPDIAAWMRSDLKDTMQDLILGEKSRSRHYFEFNYIEKLWEQHQSKKFDHSHKLFSIASFELWHRVFIDQENLNHKDSSGLL